MRRYEPVDLTDHHPDPRDEYAALLSELRAEIARQRLSQRALALAMGESNQQWLSRRLIGVTPFTVPELLALAELLGVDLPSLTAEAHRRRTAALPTPPPGGRPDPRGIRTLLPVEQGTSGFGFPKPRPPRTPTPDDRQPSGTVESHAA